MYVNFRQNRVSRSVKTVRPHKFAKNCKLHKFATTNSSTKKSSIFGKTYYFRHIHHSITSMYIKFQQNRIKIDQSKPCMHIHIRKRLQVS